MAFNNPKPASSILLLLSLLLLCLSSVSSSSSTVSEPQTVYELLTSFGLPSGLLPDTVENYSFKGDTGSFLVELSNNCFVNFSDSALITYDKKITGRLGPEVMFYLRGISIMHQFTWRRVDQIKVGPPEDTIYFRLGSASRSATKKLAVDQFKTVPYCPIQWLPHNIDDDAIPMLAKDE